MDRDGENERSVGRVTYRPRDVTSFQKPQPSNVGTGYRNAYEYSFAPLRPESVTAQSPGTTKRAGSPLSNQDLLPPDLSTTDGTKETNNNGFKNWLTSGILDVLGTAAGVTLSTTGMLVAPPLQMTKTLILPGLLALFVDTLDAITPPRVQDWFRILSSSVHHLITVLGNTEKGQLFSTQLYIVLQDLLQAISAPESRQVLVDGMATSVKFAAALNTPEMKEFLEQLSTLGVRLLDAASSGKAKQLMQDTKDLTRKGIEMAADPATTLALAEVTAHLCHALEDTQRALNPTPRKERNKQNQNIYLNPYQMADFPEQVTMEEVILSCLGRVEDIKRENAVGDDAASLPSRLTLDDDLSFTEQDDRDWKERKEQVNVQLLREAILEKGSTKTGAATGTAPRCDDLRCKERVTDQPRKDLQTKDREEATMAQEPVKRHKQENDMEDISFSCVPGARLLGLKESEVVAGASENVPAIEQFYRRLDQLLEQDRQRLISTQTRCETTIHNSPADVVYDNATQTPWKARVAKLQERARASRDQGNLMSSRSNQFLRKYQGFILAGFAFGLLFVVVVCMFALYGIYTFAIGHSGPSVTIHSFSPPSSSQEVVIRLVREIVHVTDSGELIGEPQPIPLSPEEMEEFGQTMAKMFQ